MPHPLDDLDEDQLFGLYCTTGRPRYLAAVFDRTAHELLRVALHLTRDPAAAEDIVQSTWLEAIRCARRFRRERQVLPWLLGILHNIARQHRRQRARAVDGQRWRPAAATQGRDEQDPATAAGNDEFDQAVDAAIDQLPASYRAVLVLHLRHGLSPADIAHALRRPPATVRSQLARGLEKLRRWLPGGFASALAVALTPGRGLARARRTVVLRACLASPLLAAGGAGSSCWTKMCLTACAAAALALWLGQPPAPSGSEQNLAGRRGALVADPGPRPEHAAALGGSAAQRRPAAAAAARLIVQAAGGGSGIGVRVRPVAGCDPHLAERRGYTDAAGTVRFDLPAGAVQVGLDRAPPRLVELSAGGRRRLVFDLQAGIDITGRVLDAAGAPLGGARLWLAPRGRADEAMLCGSTDQDGTFALRGVAPGYHLAALAEGYTPCATVAVTAERRDYRLQLDRRGVHIAGRIVDEAGRPLSGALVRIGSEAPPFYLLEPRHERGKRLVTNRPPVDAVTDAQGLYATASALPPRGDGRITVFVRAMGFVGERASLSLTTGTPVRRDFVLRRGGTVIGRIRTADGEPAAAARVRAGPDEIGTPAWFLPTAHTGSDGAYRLTGVSPGPAVLHVEGTAGSARIALAAVGGSRPARGDAVLAPPPAARGGAQVGEPAQPPTAKIRGMALLPDGSPASGAELRVRRTGAVAWSSHPVDVGGCFRAGPFHAGGHTLWLVHAEHPTVDLGDVDLRADSQHDTGIVRLQGGGRIAVEAVHRGRRLHGKLHLQIHRFQEAAVARPTLCSDGHVTRPLPAGRFTVRVWRQDLGVGEATAEVTAGATTPVRIAFGAALPCRFRVLGLEPSAPFSLKLTLFRADERATPIAETDYFLGGQPGSPYREVGQRLPPGRYVAQITTTSGHRRAVFPVDGSGAAPVVLDFGR